MTTHEYIDSFKKKYARLPSQVELSKKLEISPQKAIQALIWYTKEKAPIIKKPSTVVREAQESTKKPNIVTVLRSFLVLLTVMAFTLSVYFTGLWFSGRFNIIISGLISLSMVLFMVISPQTIRYVKNPLVKTVVVFAFLISLLFSMGSTIAGQYNKTSEKLEAEPDKAYQFNQLLNSEGEIVQLIKDAQEDKAIHQASITLLSSTEESRVKNWQSIATERKYIDSFDKRIDGLREELKNVRDSKINNGIIEEKRDFYLFISGLTGMEKSFTEFLISAMPAIFIDLIAALCLNLALFIKPKE